VENKDKEKKPFIMELFSLMWI